MNECAAAGIATWQRSSAGRVCTNTLMAELMTHVTVRVVHMDDDEALFVDSPVVHHAPQLDDRAGAQLTPDRHCRQPRRECLAERHAP